MSDTPEAAKKYHAYLWISVENDYVDKDWMRENHITHVLCYQAFVAGDRTLWDVKYELVFDKDAFESEEAYEETRDKCEDEMYRWELDARPHPWGLRRVLQKRPAGLVDLGDNWTDEDEEYDDENQAERAVLDAIREGLSTGAINTHETECRVIAAWDEAERKKRADATDKASLWMLNRNT